MYTVFFKRLIDILVSIIAVALLSPILLILIVLLIFANHGKPFFLQKRPGRHSKVFTIIKFRTMNDKRDVNGKLLDDYARITKIGKIMREYSLDELPQLFNVLKGDMSLIGPRPLLVSYLPLYTKEQVKRHDVRPGITGWAQINGRNAISWEQKFELDIWYVENYGPQLDAKIFMLSIQKVFVSDGVNTNDRDTMPAFQGSDRQ